MARSCTEAALEDTMFRKNELKKTVDAEPASEDEHLHEWVLSLPWVVERQHSLAPGVRTFVVDCEPLALRRLWLVTGLGRQDARLPTTVTVVLPGDAAETAEEAGWGVRRVPLPANHVLMDSDAEARPADREALVLTAYGYAMSSAPRTSP
jgi:hypothetical protein